MDQCQSGSTNWETQAQVDVCLVATGTTMDQVRRWRREGLLPDVIQDATGYAGSTVRYPTGSCAQIAAAARLFRVKNRAPYVGWQLWWEGFPVYEKHWRPLLTEKARFFDRTVVRTRAYLAQDETRENGRTLQERLAKSRVTNIVMSRIRGRQSGETLATTIAPIIQVATGEFEQFSITDDETEGKKAERALTIDALDLEASRTDAILGHRIHLARELPNMYKLITRGFSSGSLSEILQQPEQVIFRARDDVRNAFRIYVALYDAMKWVYGPAAFGLRLGAWIGKKQPDWLMPLIVLGFARLRQTTNELPSSDEIAAMAVQAEKHARDSLQLRALARTNPEFKHLITRKRLRLALQDQPAMDRFLKEIEAARRCA
jgi:hypothetical protein